VANDYTSSFFDGLRPERRLTVWQWADEHRILSSKASAEPGRYRTSRTPYMREIMEVMSVNDPTEEIVFQKSAQIGFTEVISNYVGYVIDHSPAPMLVVWPTVDMAKRNSKTRIDPLIEECPRLRECVKDKRSRDSSNTTLAKEFRGGVLVMTGANSGVGLRSMPVRFLLLDEVDGYPFDVDGEGSPIELARARTRTFVRRKIVLGSTPTIHGRSHIEDAFQRSDKRYFHVPCPHCGHYQKLVFSQLKWDKDRPETAKYECVDCRELIENWQKTTMLKAGRWIQENPGPKVVGFHINALYSPVGWYSWPDAASEWVKSHKNPEKFRAFVNTVLGEPWKERSEQPDWHRLYERREDYPFNFVPTGGLFITAGVDIQADRIEVMIRAWGRNKVSWLVDYRVLSGDTSDERTWKQLDSLLQESWALTDNADIRLPIKLMAVDSGFNTQHVYNWVRRYPPNRVIAVKGTDSMQTIVGHPRAVDVTIKGKRVSNGLKIWPVGTGIAKTELYGWLALNKASEGEPDAPGYCHFPQLGEDFFRMITAEELQIKFVKGFKKFEWVKVRERNEALDVSVYSRAAAAVCGIDRYTEEHWSRMEREMGLLSPPAPKDDSLKESPTTAAIQRPKKRRESTWL
jgi:phage terminase large subunit GpA-like protein